MAVKKRDKFFNTTNEAPEAAKKRVTECESQKERIWEIFKKEKRHLSASQVWEIYGGLVTPLTSIRRAMTVLTIEGILVKTRLKRDGIYNRPECFYRIRKKEDSYSEVKE